MASRPAGPSTEELFQLLLEQCTDYALVFTTPEGKVLDWLAGAPHIFGYSADEMVGQPVARLFTEDDRARGIPAHELAVGRSVGRMEDDRWELRKDGTRTWVAGIVVALRDRQQRLVGFAKIMRDRTDVKIQTEALENRGKALAEAEARRNAFFATVVHELRNPIAPLMSAVQVVRSAGKVEPVADAALRIVERQAEALRRLVDDLADFTRAGLGKMRLELRTLELKAVLRAVAEGVRPLAEQRGQRFELLLLEAPVEVSGDAGRLEQVFTNLLNNAVKYTPPGGKIWLKCTTEGSEAVVRVEDTGVGMSREILPKIFELFTQEAPAATADGLGVGLSLVRELVALHGGTVQGRSEGKDKGSVFTVRLPLCTPASDTP